jgi:hypothetical protein
MFPNKKGDTEGDGSELVSMLQVPVNERSIVVKIIYVCCRESELVIPSLEDRS